MLEPETLQANKYFKLISTAENNKLSVSLNKSKGYIPI